MLCELEPGDEVILPSFTFASTANAIVRMGARPVFVDIRHDTLNIDETLIETAITARTRAIIVVHYAGVACEMDTVADVARKHGLFLVEDAAQGVNAFYKSKPLGTIGVLGAYSFHHTKNYMCGEGGALCVNAPQMVERAEIIRERGTNRNQFFRGEIDVYTWVDIGSSYVPAEINCAFLLAQLEMIDEITKKRQSIHQFYHAALQPLEEEGLLLRPRIPDDCRSNYHSYHVLLPAGHRDSAIRHLKARGIEAAFHYLPLHTAPMGSKLGYRLGDLPVTEELSARLLRLPFFNEITEAQQTEVVKHLAAFLREADAADGRSSR
jgi:dTDP-4-amino-4,6-dideoxygalactose transaminase